MFIIQRQKTKMCCFENENTKKHPFNRRNIGILLHDIPFLPKKYFFMPCVLSDPVLCSHLQAGFYFADSVSSPDAYIGIKCDNILNYIFEQCQPNNKAVMGEHVNFK